MLIIFISFLIVFFVSPPPPQFRIQMEKSRDKVPDKSETLVTISTMLNVTGSVLHIRGQTKPHWRR